MSAGHPTLLGLDFSCAPTRRKPLTLAQGVRAGHAVKLLGLEALPSLDEWAERLRPAGMAAAGWHHGFVMGCDFPFGLPRPFVQALAAHGPDAAFARQREAQALVAECDRLIDALHAHCGDRAGFQRLVDADVSLPGLRTGRADAIALEAYPGLLAGEILGRRSYKSETDATPERLIARLDLIDALEQGRTRLGLRLKLTPAQRDHLAADPKGDRLDAVLCLMQAAWAQQRHEAGDAHWGLSPEMDPVEGWILTA